MNDVNVNAIVNFIQIVKRAIEQNATLDEGSGH